MLVLSLDSAGGSCGVCVWQDGKVLASAEEQMERGQDQRLMPLILDVMKRAEVDFNNLDRIAVARGPGSFTGLRIGLAAARGIGLAANKPVIGIDRFSIYREMFQSSGKNIIVIINSKRKELFCKFYDLKASDLDLSMMIPEEIVEFLKDKKDVLITGDVVVAGLDFKSATEKEVTVCAVLAAKANTNDPAFLPRPLYLRAADVTMKSA